MFDKISRKRKVTNPFEYVLIRAAASLNSPTNPEYAKAFLDPEMAEIRSLLARAFKTTDTNREDCSAAIMAYHESVATEISGDRAGAISASRTLLKYINKLDFPETWANSHLKIATTLAVSSGGSKGAVSEIVDYLQPGVLVFSEDRHPERCCLAHYNL